MQLATVSWLDVVLVGLLIGSIVIGFQQGLLRQAFLLLAIYISAVLAARYHGHLAAAMLTVFPNTSLEVARVLAFVILMVAFSVVVTWLVWSAYQQTKLPDVLMLDSLGGAALGGVIGVLALNLGLVLTNHALLVPWPDATPVKQFLQAGLASSMLQPAFVSPLPLIRAALLPWLPDGLPLML